VVYTECCLPFGLATAPLIFNLFAEALHWVLEKHLHPVAAFFALLHYLDDFIFILHPGVDPTPVIRIYDTIIARLGFPPNTAKDSCGSISDVLGYRIDTKTLMISLPPEKQNDLILELNSFVKRSCASHKQCEKLAGSLAWAAKVIYLGRSYSRSLWDFMTTFSVTHRRILPPPQLVLDDLTWWISALNLRNGVRFFQEPTLRTQYHLYTDASTSTGYGGFYFRCDPATYPTPCRQWISHSTSLLQDHVYAASPPLEHHTSHINVLEVLAIADAFTKLAPHWQHGTVHVHTDNTVALAGLQNTVLAGPANLLLRQLLIQAASFDVRLQSSWLPSIENGLADALSRFDWTTVKSFCPQLDIKALQQTL
jgi:hypothetical protein